MMQQFRLRRSTPIAHRQSIHGQIQPAFKSIDIADICRPDAVGFVDIEVAIKSVGCHRNRMTASGVTLNRPRILAFRPKSRMSRSTLPRSIRCRSERSSMSCLFQSLLKSLIGLLVSLNRYQPLPPAFLFTDSMHRSALRPSSNDGMG